MKKTIIIIGLMIMLSSMVLADTTIINETFESQSYANWSQTGSGSPFELYILEIPYSGSYSLGARFDYTTGVIHHASNSSYPNTNITLKAAVFSGSPSMYSGIAYGQNYNHQFKYAFANNQIRVDGEDTTVKDTIYNSSCVPQENKWYIYEVTLEKVPGGHKSTLVIRDPINVWCTLENTFADGDYAWANVPNQNTFLLAHGLGADPIWIYDDITLVEAGPPPPCTPDWSCSGYATCNINDTQLCNAVTDNNTCGDTYTGNYSEFTPLTCDYCTPSWSCTGYEECVSPATETSCDNVTDSNTCAETYTGNYSEFTPQACSYITGASSSGSSGTRYLVDTDGNIVGNNIIGVQQTQPKTDAPFFNIGGQGQNFDIEAWLSDLWNTIKRWFVQ